MIYNRCLKKGDSLRISVSPRLCGELCLHLYLVFRPLATMKPATQTPDRGLIASKKSSDDLQSLLKRVFSAHLRVAAPLR
jgi:hypothetical protein